MYPGLWAGQFMAQETCEPGGPVIIQLAGQVDPTCCELQSDRETSILLLFFFLTARGFFSPLRAASIATEYHRKQADFSTKVNVSQLPEQPWIGEHSSRTALLRKLEPKICVFHSCVFDTDVKAGLFKE